MSKYKFLYKLILVGDSCTGKTSIVTQYVDKNFIIKQPVTIGVEFAIGHEDLLDIDSGEVTNIKLQIWDTAGQECFRSITKSYYRNTLGAIIVFDLTRNYTFLNVENWIKELKDRTAKTMQILLVGNKKDLKYKRCVLQDDIDKLCEKHNLKYLEVSAKDYNDCKSVFRTISLLINETINDYSIEELEKIIGLKIGYSYLKQQEQQHNNNDCCIIT